MNNCNPSLINALSLCNFYSPKKAQPLTMIMYEMGGWVLKKEFDKTSPNSFSVSLALFYAVSLVLFLAS